MQHGIYRDMIITTQTWVQSGFSAEDKQIKAGQNEHKNRTYRLFV